MAIGGSEALARDVIGDRSSTLGAAAYGFAGVLGARYGDFGAYRELSAYGLVEQVYDRWSMPDRLANGIEIFDTDAMGSLVNEWSVSPGYWDLSITEAVPFVIPVDPVANVRGLSARQARTRRGRGSMFAVPSQRESASRSPRGPRSPSRPMAVDRPRAAQPVERWRAVDETRLTAYPKSMGNAGAVDATLLKFADARARVQRGSRTAIVAAPSPGVDWSPGDGLAPAARGAELMLEDLSNRFAPSTPSPVTHWLVPADAPPDVAEQIATRHSAAAPGRWIQIGRVPVTAIARPTEARREWSEPAGVLIDPGVATAAPGQDRVQAARTGLIPQNDPNPIGERPPIIALAAPTNEPPAQYPASTQREIRAVSPGVQSSSKSGRRPSGRFLGPLRAAREDQIWPPLPKSVKAARALGEAVLAGAARWSTAALDAGLGFVDDVVGSPSAGAMDLIPGESRARVPTPAGPWDRAGVLLTTSTFTPSTPAVTLSAQSDAFVGVAELEVSSTSSPTEGPLRQPPSREQEAGPEQPRIEAASPTSPRPVQPHVTAATQPFVVARAERPARLPSTAPRPIVAMLERLLGRWTEPTQTQPVIAAAARTVSRILNQLVGGRPRQAAHSPTAQRVMDLYTETGAFVVPPPQPVVARAIESDPVVGGARSSPATAIRGSVEGPIPPPSPQLQFDPRLAAGGGIVVSNDPSSPTFGPSLPPTVTALLASQGVDLESPWITWVDHLDAKLSDHLPGAAVTNTPLTSTLVTESVAGALVQPLSISSVQPAEATETSGGVGSPAHVAKSAPYVDESAPGALVRPQPSSPGQTAVVSPMHVASRAVASPAVHPSPGRPKGKRPGRGPLVSRPTRSRSVARAMPAAPGRTSTVHRLLQRGMGTVEDAPRQGSATPLTSSVPQWSTVGRAAALGQPSPTSAVVEVSPYAGWPAHLIRMVEAYGVDPDAPSFLESVADAAPGTDRWITAQYVQSSPTAGIAVAEVSNLDSASTPSPRPGPRTPRAPGDTGIAVWDLSRRLSDDRPQMGLTHQSSTAESLSRPGYADGFGSTLVPLTPRTASAEGSSSFTAVEGESPRRTSGTSAAPSAMDVRPPLSNAPSQAVGRVASFGSPGARARRRLRRSAFGQAMGLSVPLPPAPRRSARSTSNMDVMALVSQTASPVEGRAPRRLAALWAAAVEATRAPEAGGATIGGGAARPEWATVQVGRAETPSATADVTDRRSATAMVTPGNVSRALVAYGKAHAAAGGGVGAPGEVGVALSRAGRHVDSGRPRTQPKTPMSFVESPRTPGKLFGDRGPLQVKAPQDKPRVMVDTSHAEPLSEAMMRSSGAELGKRPETADQVRHRLSGETEGDLSPEEVEEIADEVIAMLRREAEFDRLVLGDDEWD